MVSGWTLAAKIRDGSACRRIRRGRAARSVDVMTITSAPTQPPRGPDDPQPHGRSVRRVVLTGVVCGVAVGAVAAVSWATRSDATNEATVTEHVSTLELDVRSGDVEVIASDRDDIAVEWRERSSLFSDATLTHQVTGSTLRVIGDCDRGFWFNGCSTDVVVRVPADVEVVAEAGAGNVTVAGLEASADIRSNAGRVRAEDQSGDLVAHSDAGPVTVDGLMADTAEVTSNAGAVSVDVAEPVTELVAESRAGNVHVTVPDGGGPYAVDATTNAGDTTVDVPTDPSSHRTIRATSNAGDVVVTRP